MPDELDILLDKVEDAALRADLRAQIDRIRAKRTFGLVFESHLPERVRLPEHAIRRGVNVVLRDHNGGPTYEVVSVRDDTATVRMVRNPDGTALDASQTKEVADETVAVDSLEVIADFGDPIYPGLRHLGSVHRGGEKPAHVVIKGENHHVLELLQFTHAGKVDCIYIDPPYNKGARDWKYDNDYVDDNDSYRHSKWLAFMERRLKLAKELLNPDASVLIVTIDETEVHRLALLLQQVFAGCAQQMVSITSNPKGTARLNEFSRVDEYALFVLVGTAIVPAVTSGVAGSEVRWKYLRRTDIASARGTTKGGKRQFYPIYVDIKSGRIVKIGKPLQPEDDLKSAAPLPGAVPVFPIREDGQHMNWGLTGPSFHKALESGYVRVTRGHELQPYTIAYLSGPNIKKAEAGIYSIVGFRPDGSKIVTLPQGKAARPTTAWREKSHDAGAHGTSLLGAVIPGRSFPFPKSLYAVEDCLRLFVKDNPDAVVLDFFAGSGTTAHAVARLNHQDGGRRQSISVTNNEVSASEADALRKQGHRPGDPEWEALGIFEHVTRPRITAAVTGLTPEGEPIKGDYKFTDEFPMADGLPENVEFFELTYLDVEDVELDQAFAGVAPLLWLRAGGQGTIVADRHDDSGEPTTHVWTAHYGILFDPDRWRSFVAAMPETARAAFIVTDSQSTFAGVAAELPAGLDVVRLYENYLTTFAVNRGR